MAIASTDLKYKLSTTAGTAGDQNSQADPNASLGKYVSTTEMDLVTTLGNLFDNVTGDENAASDVEYRCLFIANAHATLTWLSPVVWIDSEVSGGASVAIGVDPAAASAIGSSSAQAATIATEQDAPAGVTFTAPTSKATGLALGDIAAGECRAIWVKRTAANTSAVDADGATLSVSGDTAA
jgi:hypothetical protein